MPHRDPSEARVAMTAKTRIEIQNASVAAQPTRALLRRWARAALDGISESGNLCIRVVDVDEMTELNSRYRHKQGPTNVLSFAADLVAPDSDERLLGDVVICAPVVAVEAEQQSKLPANHFAHLVVHGVLHLCGYDHETDAEAQVMERTEVAILSGLGIDDPYRPIA
jgi:probable rRNA maturation factor